MLSAVRVRMAWTFFRCTQDLEGQSLVRRQRAMHIETMYRNRPVRRAPLAIRLPPACAIERYSDLLALQKIARQLEERSHALEVRAAYSISSER